MSSYDGLSTLMRLFASVKQHAVHICGSPAGSDALTSQAWLWCILHSVDMEVGCLAAGRADDKCACCHKQMWHLLHGWCITKLSCQHLVLKEDDVEKQEWMCLMQLPQGQELLLFVILSRSSVTVDVFDPVTYLNASLEFRIWTASGRWFKKECVCRKGLRSV